MELRYQLIFADWYLFDKILFQEQNKHWCLPNLLYQKQNWLLIKPLFSLFNLHQTN